MYWLASALPVAGNSMCMSPGLCNVYVCVLNMMFMQ